MGATGGNGLDKKKRALLRGLSRRPGVSEENLRQAQEELHLALPPAYQEFLLWTDGAAGAIGALTLRLWPVGEIAGYNARFGVARHAPLLVLFGTLNERTGLAFDRGSAAGAIMAVPLAALSCNAAQLVAMDFWTLLWRLHRFPTARVSALWAYLYLQPTAGMPLPISLEVRRSRR